MSQRSAVSTDHHTARLARAVSYLRVSTKEQAERGGEAEGFSLPAQRDACARKATSLGAAIDRDFADRGESATSANRPALQEMLDYINQNPVDFVIVHKVDRLARNRADDITITLAIRQSGATLVSCTENIDETPSGLLMHGIMSSIAEFYSRNLANEVIKGSVQKAKNGGTIGKAPTGYLNVRLIENGREVRTVEIDPERGPLMKWAFEEYASGTWSVRTLLEEVTRRGLTTTATARMPSRPLVLSHFGRLLRHPYYKGIVRYRGVEYQGTHPPLVDGETWRKVQDTLTAANSAGDKHKQHYHYLKGSVFCGDCGERLIISLSKNRYGVVYPYFICVGRQQKRGDCQQRAVLIDLVASKVEEYYGTVQLTHEEAEAMRATLLESLHSQREAAEHERAVQQQRLHKLATQRQKLMEAFYDDSIPGDLLKAEQARITSEMDHAQRRLQAVSAEFDVMETNLNVAIEFAKHCERAYLAASPKVRRQLNQAIFEKLYVSDDELRAEMTEPFRAILRPGAVEPSIRTTNPRHHEDVGGLRVDYVVGAEGLEPPTYAL